MIKISTPIQLSVVLLCSCQGTGSQVTGTVKNVPLHQVSASRSGNSSEVVAREFRYKATEEVIERSPNVKAVTRVTNLQGDREPGRFAISPDGTQLVFQAYDFASLSYFNLWRVLTDGSSAATRLTNGRYFDLHPVFDSTGETVLFASNRSSLLTGLWRVRSTGAGGLVRITTGSSMDVQPAGSTADGQIFYTSIPLNASEPQIWRVGVDGSLPTQMCEGENPRLSPDGETILYSIFDDRKDTYSIWKMSVDGSNPTQLFQTGEASHRYASWSPDGSKIVFASDEGKDSNGRSNYDIWLMDASGANQTQLTTNGSADIYPQFSPDGSMVYFLSNRGLDWDIWRMEIVDAQ